MEKTIMAEQVADSFVLTESNTKVDTNKLAESGWIIKTDLTETDTMTINILKSGTTELLAYANIALAEKSGLGKTLQLPEDALKNSVLIDSIWTSPHYKEVNLLPAILYFALRRGRIWQRKHIVALVKNSEGTVAKILRLEPFTRFKSIKLHNQELIPVAQALDYAIYQSYQQCHGEALAMIKKYFMAEVQETVEEWIKRFFQGSWAQAISTETISRQQYIATLCHWHQFVRQTTQHIARAIAYSTDRELRNHYIYHFKGEINHELLIEHDLTQFGYDLDFLLNFQFPAAATKQFMAIQETTIGFYQNPVLLLACPLVAEGMTAYIKPEFLEALYRRIAGWGIANPKNAARFVSSHVNTDGGDDGHWIRVLSSISKYIDGEKLLQGFLSVLYAAMHTYENAHNANIDDYQLYV